MAHPKANINATSNFISNYMSSLTGSYFTLNETDCSEEDYHEHYASVNSSNFTRDPSWDSRDVFLTARSSESSSLGSITSGEEEDKHHQSMASPNSTFTASRAFFALKELESRRSLTRSMMHKSVSASFLSYQSANSSASSLHSNSSSHDIIRFSDWINQVHRKTLLRGFEFNLMVIGESGMGKSTLVNSMFLTDIYSPEYPGPSKRASKTTAVETTSVTLKEKAANLHLTVVDTPGFGDKVNNSDGSQPIVDFIESRYADHLNAETSINRPRHITDKRVHACLYFIAPTGSHQMKSLDIECMLKLHEKVNLVPIIAKADTLTPEELADFKNMILNELASHNIKVYDFPLFRKEEEEENENVQSDDANNLVKDEESEEEAPLNLSFGSMVNNNKPLKAHRATFPFAVIGSNYHLEIDGQIKRVRRYPWGVVEIENSLYCDFSTLRRQLMFHIDDLRETTSHVFYENYRSAEFSKQFALQKRSDNLPALQQHYLDYIANMEVDARNVIFHLEDELLRQKEKEEEEIFQLQTEVAKLKATRRLMAEELAAIERGELKVKQEDEEETVVVMDDVMQDDNQENEIEHIQDVSTISEPVYKEKRNKGKSTKSKLTRIASLNFKSAPHRMRKFFSPKSK